MTVFVHPGELRDTHPVEANDGWIEVLPLVVRGWIKQFESYFELRAFLG